MEFDYVIVGAGSAGCALAARLSEDGKHQVALLEYGGSDAGPLIQMPAALAYPMNMARYDWGFQSEPEPHLNARRLACPRGKVIGGSSSINGMVYVRGHAHDFDHWAASGALGWSYADVAPYFQRMENAHGGEQGWRGNSGPVHVTRGRRHNPLYDAFVDAGVQAGFERTEDYNGARQEGFGPMEMTVWQGRRWSAANAYLKSARTRSNLSVHRGFAQRVVFDGRRAVGVQFAVGATRAADRATRIDTLRARREVIIAASAINSPKLLMLSGIGSAPALREHGIEVRADRPGVGANLQDHLELIVQYECLQDITLFSQLNLLSKARIAARWLLRKNGDGATNHFESAAFVRSRAGVRYPDIQYHFLPVAIRYDGKASAPCHGFQMHVGPMRSASRGHVRLRSADPARAPAIQFNYLSKVEDLADFRHCIRLTREIAGQAALAPFRGRELTPGEQITQDDALDDFIRNSVESAYHPCGTCRMGRVDDPLAVVDPQCKVIGVEGLRVADSSIFPRITNGNLNAPSMMVGEKAADHVLGKAPLPPSNLQPWINPRWESSDR